MIITVVEQNSGKVIKTYTSGIINLHFLYEEYYLCAIETQNYNTEKETLVITVKKVNQ